MWPFKKRAPIGAPPTTGICPMLAEPCIMSRCAWWIHVSGQDPQHEHKQIDMWDCAIRWGPALAIDAARQTAGVHAALNSFRNEMVDANKESRKYLNNHTGAAPPGADGLGFTTRPTISEGETNE